MKRLQILIDVDAEQAALAALLARRELHILQTSPSEEQRSLPVELIRDAEVLFCTYPPANYDQMCRIRWIQVSSTGYSQLLEYDLPSSGVRATNSRGCFDVPIAEWNVAMMINLIRDVPSMLRNQRAHVWDRSAQFQRELLGLTVGLWGYGGIGRETARLARSLGMRVHVLSRNGVRPRTDIYRVPETGDPEGVLPHRVFLQGQELEFLASLDFLILAMPLTPQTKGIVGECELCALPRRAFLLNPARGPLVEEQALLKALREGWISGAALDTHYAYPVAPAHPLWDFTNVIFTPHISGSSLNPMYTYRLWQIFTENVDRYLSGEKLLNELTPDELRGRS